MADQETHRQQPALTLADLADLPPTLDIPSAARLLGISRSAGYQLAAMNEFPVRIIRIGHTLRVPTAPLLTLLGVAGSTKAPPSTPGDRDTD